MACLCESTASLHEETPVCSEAASRVSTNFIKQIMEEDLASGKHSSIITRFPPEPNGFLHLGHAKSIFLNFGLAKLFGGVCHLRFDDTNAYREEHRYVEAIKKDVKWLGFDWGDKVFFASDYFLQLYEWAEKLIVDGLAYVDHQTPDEIKTNRGSITSPGKSSPYSSTDIRCVDENLRLFREMREGKMREGECVLRAKIDMASPNMCLRDPVIYRILTRPHPRTGSAWCIYPMYDFAHGQSDSLEKITHSVCTVEFELNRALYEWLQEKLQIYRTRQIEFARLNCTYTVMSKRKLLTLVEEGWVNDWDDPRMPTLSGLRRRGYPKDAIQEFCERIGVAKRENLIQIELLENCVREVMNRKCLRRFGVLNPVKLVITNYPENQVEYFEGANHPDRPDLGSRQLPFSRVLWIEQDDICTLETPPPKYHRLAVRREVRLRYAYWVRCVKIHYKEGVGESENREKVINYIECTYDPTTKGGVAPSDGRKVKGTLHWISAEHANAVEYRIYDRLFTVPIPDKLEEIADEDCGVLSEEARCSVGWRKVINKESLKVLYGYLDEMAFNECLESSNSGNPTYPGYQLERLGYFTTDYDTTTRHNNNNDNMDSSNNNNIIDDINSSKGHVDNINNGNSVCNVKPLVVLNMTVGLNDNGELPDGTGTSEEAKKIVRENREKAIEQKKLKKLQQQLKSLSKAKETLTTSE